jgi:arylsulfatase A-like enzyme
MIPVCPKYIEYVPDMHQGESYEKTRRLRINRMDFGCCHFEKGLVSESIARYDGEIEHADTSIGLLISEIKQLCLFENSVIVLTADHGESLGDHDFYFDHGRFPYNACLKIPLMIHHPKLKPKEVESVVSLTDMFPTILGILGIHSPCEGEDISGILLGRERRRTIFSSAGYALNYQKIITDGRWKLIYVPDELDQSFMNNATYQLYDLMKDPGETKNLYGSSVKGMYLKDELDDFLKNEFKEFTLGRGKLNYSEENLQQLKSLGYIN